MDSLVMMLFFAVIAGLWWWLAKRMKRSGRGWFLRNLAGSSAGVFAGFVVVALAIELGVIESTPKQADAVAESQATAAPQPPMVTPEPDVLPPASIDTAPVKPEVIVKTLGLTPVQYAARLNALLKKLERPYRVDGSAIIVGEVNNVLNASLGEHAALVAGVSEESGEVLDVVIMGAGDGTDVSGLEIMMVASAALASAAPGAEPGDVFKALPDMIKGKHLTYGEIKLSVKTMDQLGTWFFASPI